MKNLLFLLLLFSSTLIAQKTAKTPKLKKPLAPVYDEFFKKAKFIFEAEPVSYKSYFVDKDTNDIYTSISLKVRKIYKGRITADTVELVRKGGEINYNHSDIKKDRCQIWLTGKYILFCNKSTLPVDPKAPKKKSKPVMLSLYKDIPDGILTFNGNKRGDYYLKGFDDLQFKSAGEFNSYIKKIPGIVIIEKEDKS